MGWNVKVYVSGHSVENNKERLVEDVSSCV